MRSTPQKPRLSSSAGKSTWWSVALRLNDCNDTRAACWVAACLIIGEVLLCTLIIQNIRYTKIDWDAYMSQVEGFLNGERDYSKLEGDTGPLVYPGGFLFIFSALRAITGGEVASAQVVFAFLYVLSQAIVFAIYIQTHSVPPWALLLLSLSKRMHSIFLLRLFNDAIAMTLLYSSLLLILPSSRPRPFLLSLLIFSAAVSVKMNILLFAPSLLVLLLKGTSREGVLSALVGAAVVQILMGFPFLLSHPDSYLSRAFDLGRIFIHFWSVNFKFLPEDVFVSKSFALTLLVVHLLLLLLFAHFKWCRHEGGLIRLLLHTLRISAPLLGGEESSASSSSSSPSSSMTQSTQASSPVPFTPQHAFYVMACGNFIGIIFARSLHYQFYSWYFHTIPFLLWQAQFPTLLRLTLWGLIEVSWNVFPSTPSSSLMLLACHAILLLGLARTPIKNPYVHLTDHNEGKSRKLE